MIKILALYNIAFGIFHLFFWKLLKWKTQLEKISPTNKAVMQTLNICLTFMFFLIGYSFYRHSVEIEQSDLGSTLLLGTSLFWLIRTLLQLYFFNMKARIHKVLFLLFLVGAIMHITPFLV